MSPDTVHNAFDAPASNLVNVANISNQGKDNLEVVELGDDETPPGLEDDDDDIKEVDADDNTLPRPGSGAEAIKVMVSRKANGSYEVKDTPDKAKVDAKVVKKRTESVGNKGASRDENGETPREAKARATLKTLVENAKREFLIAQDEVKDKAEKANRTKEEQDLKVAEKAAATAKRKFLALEGKLENLKSNADSLRKMSTSGKRVSDNQSPGKEEENDDDDGWKSVEKKGGKKSQNDKKKMKEKSKEALEIERSFFEQ